MNIPEIQTSTLIYYIRPISPRNQFWSSNSDCVVFQKYTGVPPYGRNPRLLPANEVGPGHSANGCVYYHAFYGLPPYPAPKLELATDREMTLVKH